MLLGELLGAYAGRQAMEGQHWVMLAVALIVGFVIARTQMGTQLAQKVGLS